VPHVGAVDAERTEALRRQVEVERLWDREDQGTVNVTTGDVTVPPSSLRAKPARTRAAAVS